MSEYKYFKCVKSFTVEAVDDDGFFLENEPPVTILKDTVWQVAFTNGKPKWVSFQVNGYGSLMEMRKEHWEDEEYFEEIALSEVEELEE